jgi:hypothetical protein
MRISCHRLDPNETDYEFIWLCVTLVALGAAAAWFALGLPWPRCVFHEITGLPCLTCGMTRCAIQLFHGHFLAAFKWNPVVFVALCGVMAFDLYAFATLTTRAPRLRISILTQRARTFVRVCVILALLLNWVYLLSHWRNF